VGFVILVWAADRFVLGAAAVARNFGVSTLVIGLTIVGFGTSAPELLVSAVAASFGSAELCVGNAIGSNITNITLVLGAAALMAPMDVKGTVLRRELPVLVACMLLATGLMLDGNLGRIDGVVLALGLVGMMGWVVWLGMRSEDPDTHEEIPESMKNSTALFWVVVGLLLLLGASRLLVWGAVEVATMLHVPELVIGLSVVAVGTSLPELAASVMAARRGEHDLAVGNVIGSNMFNTLGVLALPGLIRPHDVGVFVLRRDLPAMFGVTFLFFVMTRFFLRPAHVSRLEGGVLVTAFVGYMAWVYLTIA
ncbi:MAG: calcium/sodium antiporter, partial [Myxococcales bacterium]|nr:calcium/sodium antiporter [Myxococcales bacterium]